MLAIYGRYLVDAPEHPAAGNVVGAIRQTGTRSRKWPQWHGNEIADARGHARIRIFTMQSKPDLMLRGRPFETASAPRSTRDVWCLPSGV